MENYELYRTTISILLENAEQFNSKISPPPSEALTGSSIRTLTNVLEGRSLLSMPNYTIELYDTDLNDLFWVLMNLFANEKGIQSDAYEKHALFTLRDKDTFDKVQKGLTSLGVKFSGLENDKTRDGYFDANIDVNNLSPFPGNMGIRKGVR